MFGLKAKLLKSACTLFVLALAVCNFGFFAVNAEEPEKPEIGQMWAAGWDSDGKEYNNKDGKINYLDTQGQFNFYFWYAPHSNGKSEIDKLKMCVPGSPLLYPNISAFMPEEDDIKEVEDNEYQYNCEYFGFTDWGAMSGSSGFGKVNGFDPAIQFQAPIDGKYEIEILVGGGIRLDEYGDKQVDTQNRSSDGVIWRVLNNNKKEVFTAEFKQNATKDCFNNPNGSFKQEFELKKGQGVYLLLDQIKDSICDDGYFSFRAKLVSYEISNVSEEEPSSDNSAVSDEALSAEETKGGSVSPLLIIAVAVSIVLFCGMIAVIIILRKVLKKG
ncbi:MAG: hypothetical protein ACI4F7_00720 [Acutalibacteraceae bacterium]